MDVADLNPSNYAPIRPAKQSLPKGCTTRKSAVFASKNMKIFLYFKITALNHVPPLSYAHPSLRCLRFCVQWKSNLRLHRSRRRAFRTCCSKSTLRRPQKYLKLFIQRRGTNFAAVSVLVIENGGVD